MRRRKNSRAPTLMSVAVTAFLCLPHTAMAESGKLSAAEQLSAETAEAAAEQSTAETADTEQISAEPDSLEQASAGLTEREQAALMYLQQKMRENADRDFPAEGVRRWKQSLTSSFMRPPWSADILSALICATGMS